MIWQAAYAEFVPVDTLWPDFDRRHLWYACEVYAKRDRRFGGAIPPGRLASGETRPTRVGAGGRPADPPGGAPSGEPASRRKARSE